MPNKKIAELISQGLREGLMAPGVDGAKPTPLVLPGFRTAGMPKEMADLVDETSKLLGEAIVLLIEDSGSVIVDKTKMEELAIAEADESANRQVAVHCRCDSGRISPLAIFTITNSPVVLVDGKQLIAGLSKRSPEHPHEMLP